MATILSVADIIELGDATTYLAANYVSNGSIFGQRIIQPNLPVQIAFVTDGLRWGSESGAETDASLRSTANYLYWMCGKFQLEAQRIINGAGGGSVAPTPSIGSLPNPYDWEIGETTSATEPMKQGDSTVTLNSFKGFNIEFTRGGITQNTTSLGDGTSYFTWNRVTAVFFCSPSASLGELFRILPASAVAPTADSIEVQTEFTEGFLEVGQTYELTDYMGGDDFDNVADVQEGIINTDGCVFIATGTTPTNWTNSSLLTLQ